MMRRAYFHRLSAILAGAAAGLALVEILLRIVAPLLNPSLRAILLEEAHLGARSTMRVAQGARVILREREVRSGADLLLIGDSMVFGMLVDEHEAWSARLAERTGAKVLNLGVPAASPCEYNSMLGMALQRLPQAPKVVVYTVFANDFAEVEEHFQGGGKTCAPVPTQKLYVWDDDLQRSGWYAVRRARERLLQHSLIFQLGKSFIGFGNAYRMSGQSPLVEYSSAGFDLSFVGPDWWRPLLDPTQPQVARGIERALANTRDAQAQARSSGASFVLVLMPFKEQVYTPWLAAQGSIPPEMYAPFYDSVYDQFAGSAAAGGVCVLDLRPALREAAKRGERLYWTVDGHLTPHGNEVTANEVARGLSAVAGGVEAPAGGDRTLWRDCR